MKTNKEKLEPSVVDSAQLSKTVEELYSLAYTLYDQGHYARASDLFQMIVWMDATKSQYWMALGAAYQMHKQYEKALEAYIAVTLFDDRQADPFPLIHLAECWFALNFPQKALELIKQAEMLALPQPHYQKLCEQLQIMWHNWSVTEIKGEIHA